MTPPLQAAKNCLCVGFVRCNGREMRPESAHQLLQTSAVIEATMLRKAARLRLVHDVEPAFI